MSTTSITSDGQANRYPNWKTAAMYVLAGLISNPLFYTDVSYSFDIADFPEQFHKVVFGAVDHLIKGGMTKIDYYDIDNYLKPYAVAYKIFTDNRGIEYIQKALQLYDSGKFDYSYNNLKKYSLLAKMNELGIDTKRIYDPDILETRANAAMQVKFDAMSVSDILLTVETDLMHLRDNFVPHSTLEEGSMADGIAETIKECRVAPMMGLPFTSPKLTTIYLGARKGCFYLESADTGVGKSRHMNAEACHLAYPWYYDLQQKMWVNTGLRQRVLFISTELERKQQQRMCLAYISGVEENKIILNHCTPEENARVDRAGQIMEEYKDNLFFLPMSVFTADSLSKSILEYNLIHHVEYVFFDYLMSNEEMLSEGSRKMKVANIREDMLLFDVSTMLKELTKTKHIMIWTATQLSGDISQASFLDKYCIRGAKSIADKGEDCAIFADVRDVDKPMIELFCPKAKAFLQAGKLQTTDDPTIPNAVFHIYKTRDGKYGKIKLFVHFDRGTCRLYDCFAVDTEGHRVDIPDTVVHIDQNGGVESSEEKSGQTRPVVQPNPGPLTLVHGSSVDVVDDELPDFSTPVKEAPEAAPIQQSPAVQPKVDANGEVVLPSFDWSSGF